MKTSAIRTTHPGAIIDGWVEDTLGSDPSTIIDPEKQNASGGALTKGDVVVVNSAGQITTTTVAGYTGIVGVVLDDIDAGDYGPVAFAGPVDLINVVGSVTAGNYGETSSAPKKAQDGGATLHTGSFVQFTSSGTAPSGILLGSSSGSPSAAEIQSAARSHQHTVSEPINADGASQTYYLANWPDDNTVAAYQAGLRVDIIQVGDAVTFAGIPPINAALRFDYILELT